MISFFVNRAVPISSESPANWAGPLFPLSLTIPLQQEAFGGGQDDMTPKLWTIPLRQRRDALQARQRARQIAGLLGFEFFDQACISAGVFAIAWQALQTRSQVELCFQIDRDTFQIFARTQNPTGPPAQAPVYRMEKKLPPGEKRLALEDVVWSIAHLDKYTPDQLYEEIHRQNQELLSSLHGWQSCRQELEDLQRLKANPSAA